MGQRPTIQTVAERAGVSRGTVDRVLNNRSYVRAEVRERVEAAIRETGYLSPRDARSAAAERGPMTPLTLGVLLPSWHDDSLPEIERGVEAARQKLAESSVTVLSDRCETDLPGEAVQRLNGLLAKGAQGIALCAAGDPAIVAQIDLLADRGVPVVTFNSDLPESRRLCFVGEDYLKSGRIAGELMSKCVPLDAPLLAVVGNLEFDGHRRRLEGFCARLREKGVGAEQIEVIETYNDYAVTRRRVSEALGRIPGLRGIYMANQSVAGCAEAVRAAGMRGTLRIITHDVSESTRLLLKSGDIDLTISQDMFRQGYDPLNLLRDALQKGRAPTPPQASTNINVICAENLD